MESLHRLGSKISACMVKENSNSFRGLHYLMMRDGVKYGRFTSRELFENELKDMKDILSTRLMDETSHGIINIETAVILETSIEEIQNALVN